MGQTVESGGYSLSDAQFERFRALVYREAGIALRDEKRQLVCSRLSKRLRQLQMTTFEQYYEHVCTDGAGELEHMLNAITTNKTAFYREAHHFSTLAEEHLRPKLKEAQGGPVRIRVWSAGCSTGEEVYTSLITILEAIPQWEVSDIRALASDLDTNVLAHGERGVYAEDAIGSEVPRDLASRWFIRGSGDQAGKVRVRRPLRERVAFRRINFIDAAWPVRTKFDAIFCRNALIYFDAATQQQIVSRLLSYLEPGGLFFLGHSESMAGVRSDLLSLGRTSYRYLGSPS